MPASIDLIGQKFGRLVVLKKKDKNKSGNYRWLCKCDCGIEKIVLGSSLKSGHTKSCGCLQKEKTTKHGHNKTKTYHSWANMIQRCTNPNDQTYHYYGGRGIKVCGRWMKFVNFLEDMGEPPTNKHSIDRIDNNQGYYKENCKWSTRKEQMRNKRSNHLETYKGKTQCITDWAEEYNICPCVLRGRIKLGWSMKKALTTPVRKKKKRKK